MATARDQRRHPGPCRAVPVVAGTTTSTSPPSRTSSAAAGGAGSPSPGRTRRRSRSAFAAYQGARARHPDGERHRHDGGRLQGARHRLGRRGDRAGAHVHRDGVRADRGRRAPRLRRRHARHVDDRPRRWSRRRSPTDARDHAGAPRAPDGRHGPDHGRSRGAHGLAVVEDCAHAHGQRWNDQGAGCIGDFGSFSHQSSKILTAGEGGSLLTNDETARAAAPTRSSTAAAPKDDDEKEYTFGANYRLCELHAALLEVAMRAVPRAAGRARRARRVLRGAGRRASRASA